MQIYTHTLPGGAQLIGYLRDRTVEMPAFNTRPAILILPGGGYAWCSKREADPVAMQFLQAGYNVFTLYYTCRSDETVPALRWQPLIDAAGAILHIRRNAEQFGTDPAKIAICGFSAGGHLAASTAILRMAGRPPGPPGGRGSLCRPPLASTAPRPAPMPLCWAIPSSRRGNTATTAPLSTSAAMTPTCAPQ